VLRENKTANRTPLPGADPGSDHGEQGRAYNGGVGSEPPATSRGDPAGGQRGKATLKLNAFCSYERDKDLNENKICFVGPRQAPTFG